ncbi:MAG: ABC transporter permease [Bryobacteraceae bacterium]
MADRKPMPVRVWERWLLRTASWLAPAIERTSWRTRKETELREFRLWFQGRNLSEKIARAQVHRFLLGSFREAFDLRFPGEDPRSLIRRLARGPIFTLVLLTAVLAALITATGALAGIRAAFAPLPYSEPSRLVACFQLHFLSASLGAQSRYFRPWRDRSQTLQGLAAYRVREFELDQEGFRPALISGADVTANFFPLLGTRAHLGRTFAPGDSGDPPSVVVGYDFWKNYLRSSSALESLEVQLDGQRYRVMGVLPPTFWFRSRQLTLFTVMPDPGRPGTRSELLGMVGRLRSGATAEAAKEELQRIALYTRGIRSGPVRVLPLAEYQRPALASLLAVAAFGMVLAALIGAVQIVRATRRGLSPPGEAWRYWGFFAAKLWLLTGIILLAAAELAARNALSLRSGKFLFNLVLEWLVILGILLAFRWGILDQGRRCPVCLRRLAMPVSTGIWSSLLINPAGTELLCDQGHGALTVSATGGLVGEVRRWITLEDDWRTLTSAGNGPPREDSSSRSV